MGLFPVRATVAHPADPTRRFELDLLVDTGATLSWIPRAVIQQLDAPRLPRRSFMVADGRVIERETAGVIVQVDGIHAIVTVVVAEAGDGHLLGATALETLGFGVDPVRQQLIPRELLAM